MSGLETNADQSTRTVNYPGPYVIKKPATTTEWIPANGTCVICATPYPSSGGKGTPGISLCYRVTFTQSSTVTAMTASIQPIDDETDKTISIEEVDNTLTSNVVEGNQWVLNGEDIEGATGPTYEPRVPGDYFVRNTTRPRFDVSNLIKVNVPPSPREPKQVRVYPNPASDYLDITVLAIIFQPAHVVEGTAYPVPDRERNMQTNWAVHQLLTTTNFANNSKWFSWYVGELNFQIEHHLFPNICHVHYAKIAPIVRSTAREFGLPYKSKKSFFDAIIGHMRMLKSLGEKQVQQ